MKALFKHIVCLAVLICGINLKAENKDIYLVYYATIDGKSGHVGIAFDNYKIRIKDTLNAHNERTVSYDTLKIGTLTYYDLWPQKDNFNAFNINDDVEAIYYKLPKASWENPITLSSLLKKGIPQEEDYPIDGLIGIKTSPTQDYKLQQYIKELIKENAPFNARTFNCADFVERIIEHYCACTIKADESIVFKWSTTPNRLYQEVLKLKDTYIIKDGSEKAKGKFTVERLIKRTNNQ